MEGKFFHRLEIREDGRRHFKWQGRVLDVRGDHATLETFEWSWGTSHLVETIPLAEMRRELWRFYDSASDMRDAYRVGKVREERGRDVS